MFHRGIKMQLTSESEQLKKNPPFIQVKETRVKDIRKHLKTKTP